MATLLAPSESFSAFLDREKGKDLLRFTTAGSVDDGKSTLIGRLLYDSRSVYDDQLESVTKASAGRNAGAIDFSLLTDGLRAEREQGITIDVAYRYFATPRRKFIIADTPGHEQYTRNMVTGASTAELAIVLVDARKGVLVQSRRHSYIAGLLGIERVVIAVNKMDLVGYDETVFTAIEKDFRAILARFPHIEPYFVPVSALAGDNIVTRSANMPRSAAAFSPPPFASPCNASSVPTRSSEVTRERLSPAPSVPATQSPSSHPAAKPVSPPLSLSTAIRSRPPPAKPSH
jgi:small GTP-binding protein